jgi:hypothetical protein
MVQGAIVSFHRIDGRLGVCQQAETDQQEGQRKFEWHVTCFMIVQKSVKNGKKIV